ncbi:hypothetical protein LX81_02179 [Palleronia aestuarii]|uniref:Exopolysaccharide synthesis protein ExoD n=1 Tax=Palleronia aestuarii TaxID=568105 RepID=A0A2W7NE01_9RHOB|nr:exopolysaccharide biosynthesis protein [Palleronia aestuarii]PZX16327.1 hypothetical protein LX81_02179 [Palleronia aestuarii]
MAQDGIGGILDDLDDLAGSEDTVSVADVMDKLGHRGSGVFLFVPAILGVSPLSAIPTLPTFFALIVLIVAVQIALGRDRVWMPRIIKSRAVDDDRLHSAVEWMRGPARRLDRWFGNRLEILTGPAANRVAAILCAVLACIVPPLEFVPLAAALPHGAIAAIGLALVLRDGILMLLAFAVSAGALYTAFASIVF